MNKAERVKLHSILIRIAESQDEMIEQMGKLNDRMDGLNASQVVLGTLALENETDIKNILHVLKETQRQQQASAGRAPDLRVIHGEENPKPAE